MRNLIFPTILILCVAVSIAKVDLVTLPAKDMTQLTIYNSADLTLVRDARSLTLKEGANKLQFSWANTLIDPTSLSMLPKAHADKIDIADLTFPPRVQNLGLWNIESGIGGKVPIEITYLTSGLSWRAFYMGTLTEDEKTMRLQGYVRVTNNSGEDYENAQTRLIVGKVNVLDRIAELAQRQYPYGRPGEPVPMPKAAGVPVRRARMLKEAKSELIMVDSLETALKAKEIKKEGLSEYFLYTIEGTETIPHTWSKRLPSFDTDEIPVVNLYKFEEERGRVVRRYLSFTNDQEHELGETPIPGGGMKVYRTVDDDQHLSYEGTSSFKYIPVGEEVELNLGAVSDVIVEPKLMDEKTDNYRFGRKGNIDGWDQIRTFQLEVKNTRDLPVKIEIKRNFGTNAWDIKNVGKAKKYYEKVDLDTVKYTLTLEPESEQTLEYILTTYHGVRAEDWTKAHRDD
ncbi:MAG: DUF4139 domain-containing protein [Phycisphaerae bacterium]|nr:DUF4139 domain-containing protein [Phycisphaerae bacterium]